jgi:hypothetical protein
MAPTEINSLFIKAASAVLAHCTAAAAEHGVKVGEARELPFADSIAERHRLISVGVKHAGWMDSLKKNLSDGAGWVKDKATQVGNKVMDSKTYEDPAVLAGLGSAAAGGIGTMMTDRRPGEGFGGKTMRVGRNALLAGLLGGGSAAALSHGVDKIMNALPKNDKSPGSTLFHSPQIRALFGLGGYGWTTRKTPFMKDPLRDIVHISEKLPGIRPGANGLTQGGATANPQVFVEAKQSILDNLKDKLTGKGRVFAKSEMQNLAGGALGHDETRGLLGKLRGAGINYGKTDFGPLKDWSKSLFGRMPDISGMSGASGGAGVIGASAPSLRDALSAATERARVGARGGFERLAKGRLTKGLAAAGVGYYLPDILDKTFGGLPTHVAP